MDAVCVERGVRDPLDPLKEIAGLSKDLLKGNHGGRSGSIGSAIGAGGCASGAHREDGGRDPVSGIDVDSADGDDDSDFFGPVGRQVPAVRRLEWRRRVGGVPLTAA